MMKNNVLKVTGETYEDTPKWWRNFIGSEIDPLPHSQSRASRADAIETILKKYHGQPVFGELGTDAILFEEEKYLTIFLLRWS